MPKGEKRGSWPPRYKARARSCWCPRCIPYHSMDINELFYMTKLRYEIYKDLKYSLSAQGGWAEMAVSTEWRMLQGTENIVGPNCSPDGFVSCIGTYLVTKHVPKYQKSLEQNPSLRLTQICRFSVVVRCDREVGQLKVQLPGRIHR